MDVITLDPLWPDWRVVDDSLFDDAGNRYGIWEIRSLPYVFGLNYELNRIIERLRLPCVHEPEQLVLPFPPMWIHQYEWLRRLSDRH